MRRRSTTQLIPSATQKLTSQATLHPPTLHINHPAIAISHPATATNHPATAINHPAIATSHLRTRPPTNHLTTPHRMTHQDTGVMRTRHLTTLRAIATNHPVISQAISPHISPATTARRCTRTATSIPSRLQSPLTVSTDEPFCMESSSTQPNVPTVMDSRATRSPRLLSRASCRGSKTLFTHQHRVRRTKPRRIATQHTTNSKFLTFNWRVLPIVMLFLTITKIS